jgi:hypothetical protein
MSFFRKGSPEQLVIDLAPIRKSSNKFTRLQFSDILIASELLAVIFLEGGEGLMATKKAASTKKKAAKKK